MATHFPTLICKPTLPVVASRLSGSGLALLRVNPVPYNCLPFSAFLPLPSLPPSLLPFALSLSPPSRSMASSSPEVMRQSCFLSFLTPVQAPWHHPYTQMLKWDPATSPARIFHGSPEHAGRNHSFVMARGL